MFFFKIRILFAFFFYFYPRRLTIDCLLLNILLILSVTSCKTSVFEQVELFIVSNMHGF